WDEQRIAGAWGGRRHLGDRELGGRRAAERKQRGGEEPAQGGKRAPSFLRHYLVANHRPKEAAGGMVRCSHSGGARRQTRRSAEREYRADRGGPRRGCP